MVMQYCSSSSALRSCGLKKAGELAACRSFGTCRFSVPGRVSRAQWPLRFGVARTADGFPSMHPVHPGNAAGTKTSKTMRAAVPEGRTGKPVRHSRKGTDAPQAGKHAKRRASAATLAFPKSVTHDPARSASAAWTEALRNGRPRQCLSGHDRRAVSLFPGKSASLRPRLGYRHAKHEKSSTPPHDRTRPARPASGRTGNPSR